MQSNDRSLWSAAALFTPGTVLAGATGATIGYVSSRRNAVVSFLARTQYVDLLGASMGFTIATFFWLYYQELENHKRKSKEAEVLSQLKQMASGPSSKAWDGFSEAFASEFAWSHSHKEQWKNRYRFALCVLVGSSVAATYPYEEGSRGAKLRPVFTKVGIVFSSAIFAWSLGVYQAYNNGLNGFYKIKFDLQLEENPRAKVELYQKELNEALQRQNQSFESAFTVLRGLWKFTES